MPKQRPLFLGEVDSLPDRRDLGIENTLRDALDAHGTFDSVMVVAEVRLEDGIRAVRVYTSNLNRKERIGLAEEAKDALMGG
jgi:hypothetical protein